MAIDWSQTPERLDRKSAARYLNDLGFPIAHTTLRTLPSPGSPGHADKGPPYVLFGSRALYTKTDLKAWAESRSKRRGG